eukprot:m.991748 g.991748  ORF g.991748 m.991748 type:complete len:78 (-) comp24003_c0_seq73:2307-2540(-)
MALSDAMLRAGCTLRLRRFSKDLGYIDDLLPLTGLDFFSLALFTVSTVVRRRPSDVSCRPNRVHRATAAVSATDAHV